MHKSPFLTRCCYIASITPGRSPDGAALLPALRYNATIDERRYTPRAHLDESGERHTQKGLVLLAGQEHCDRLQFHVLVSVKENKAGVSSSASPGGRASRPSKDALCLVQNSDAPGCGRRSLKGFMGLEMSLIPQLKFFQAGFDVVRDGAAGAQQLLGPRALTSLHPQLALCSFLRAASRALGEGVHS